MLRAYPGLDFSRFVFHSYIWHACLQAKFDVEAAVAAMKESIASTGYFRDKFGAWEAAEAELVCDCAGRHHYDDVASLSQVLDTKEPTEVRVGVLRRRQRR